MDANYYRRLSASITSRSGLTRISTRINAENIMNFAVIETGGKQYKVSPGQKLKIEKIEGELGANLNFDKVLLLAENENVKIGAPYIEGAKVEAKILKQGREKKKIVFKYHSKTRYRKKKGHRQPFTEVQILNIEAK